MRFASVPPATPTPAMRTTLIIIRLSASVLPILSKWNKCHHDGQVGKKAQQPASGIRHIGKRLREPIELEFIQGRRPPKALADDLDAGR